jgi:hypothetical protein
LLLIGLVLVLLLLDEFEEFCLVGLVEGLVDLLSGLVEGLLSRAGCEEGLTDLLLGLCDDRETAFLSSPRFDPSNADLVEGLSVLFDTARSSRALKVLLGVLRLGT